MGGVKSTWCTKDNTQNGIQTLQVESRPNQEEHRYKQKSVYVDLKTPHLDTLQSLSFTLKMSLEAEKRHPSPRATAATLDSVLVIFHHHLLILPAPGPS